MAISVLAGVFAAIINIGIGAWGVFYPSKMARAVSLKAVGAHGLTEIRTTFGGVWIALGVYLLLFPSPLAFQSVAVVWLGLAVARTITAFVDQCFDKKTIRLLTIEIGVLTMLLAGGGFFS